MRDLAFEADVTCAVDLQAAIARALAHLRFENTLWADLVTAVRGNPGLAERDWRELQARLVREVVLREPGLADLGSLTEMVHEACRLAQEDAAHIRATRAR